MSQALVLVEGSRKIRIPNAPWLRGVLGAVVPVPELSVRWYLPWREAVRAGASHTLPSSLVMDLEKAYPPERMVRHPVPCTMLLVAARRYCSTGEMFAWASDKGLSPAHPRAVFAFGEQYPDFEYDTGGPTYLVTLNTCKVDGVSHCCTLRFEHGYQEARLVVSHGGWNGQYWFAFVFKSASL